MEFSDINIVKYILGFLTTSLGVYSLTFDFRVEVKRSGKKTIKKLTRAGLINLIAFVVLGIATIFTSHSEDVQSGVAEKQARISAQEAVVKQQKIADLEKELLQKNNRDLERNLNRIEEVALALDLMENAAFLRNQQSNEQQTRLMRSVKDFSSDLSLSSDLIKEFEQSIQTSRDEFTGLHISCMVSQSYSSTVTYTGIRAADIMNQEREFATEEEEEAYYENLDEFYSEYVDNETEDVDKLYNWLRENEYSTLGYIDLVDKLKTESFMNDDKNRREIWGQVLDVVENVISKIDAKEGWIVILDLDQQDKIEISETLTYVDRESLMKQSDFDILTLGVSNVVFKGAEIQFQLDIFLTSKNGMVYRISEVRAADLYLKNWSNGSNDVRIDGSVTLNNSLKRNIPFNTKTIEAELIFNW